MSVIFKTNFLVNSYNPLWVVSCHTFSTRTIDKSVEPKSSSEGEGGSKSFRVQRDGRNFNSTLVFTVLIELSVGSFFRWRTGEEGEVSGIRSDVYAMNTRSNLFRRSDHGIVHFFVVLVSLDSRTYRSICLYESVGVEE